MLNDTSWWPRRIDRPRHGPKPLLVADFRPFPASRSTKFRRRGVPPSGKQGRNAAGLRGAAVQPGSCPRGSTMAGKTDDTARRRERRFEQPALRTYFIYRHVCDGGDVGCSFRRIARSNMSILQGRPTTRYAPARSLRDRVLSLPQWARNGRRPLLSAPSLRVAARTGDAPERGAGAPVSGDATVRARVRNAPSLALSCPAPGSHPSTHRLETAPPCAGRFVAQLDPIDIGPAPYVAHSSRPDHNASRACI